MSISRTRALVVVAAIVASLGGGAAGAQDTVSHESVRSVGDVDIRISIHKPAAASPSNKVPVILHSHGWGGQRARGVGDFAAWLADGFGVVSIDQRGHGESGGEANVEDPDLEGQDVKAIIDRVAQLNWVALDGPNDPVLGAIGGSYGGGYQTIGALTEVRDTGRTRFNAISPQITWYDLPDSLGPQGVPRTLWTTLLYAVAPRHASYIDEGFAVGAATFTFPDGTVPGTTNLKQIFYEHSPAWFVDNGMRLDIPALIGQGITDNLFNLNQGWHNFVDTLTPAAQERSILIGYNGGHVLPEVLPLSTNPSGNQCVSNYQAFERLFFKTVFAGGNPRAEAGLKAAPFNLSTGSRCIAVSSLDPNTVVQAGPGGALVAPSAGGAPVAFELAQGPITVAGIPRLSGSLTTVAAEARAFFALSVGTSAADARPVQNNLLPIRRMLPTVDEQFDLELPGIAVDVPAGSNLYLTVSPAAGIFGGPGSRVPGAMVIRDAIVALPVAS